jgi:hypothetical protein
MHLSFQKVFYVIATIVGLFTILILAKTVLIPDSAELHSVPTKKILNKTQHFFFNTRHYKTYKGLKINIIAIQNIVSLFWLAL